MAQQYGAGLTLIQRLAKIQEMCGAIKKEKQGYGYKYTDVVDILAKVTAGMKKYQVSLIPMINPGTASTELIVTENKKFDKNGRELNTKNSEMMVSAEMTYRWINNDNSDDYIDVPWFLVGKQSDPSQAMGSALTYGERYFLTKFFHIAEPELDVDTYRSKQKEAEEAEDKAILKEIIEEFYKISGDYIKENPDKQEEVTEFIKKYTDGKKAGAIKDLGKASKLLNDFNAKYIMNMN